MDEVTNKGANIQSGHGQRAHNIPVGRTNPAMNRRATGMASGQRQMPMRKDQRMSAQGQRRGVAAETQKGGVVKSEKTINILDKVIAVCVFMLFFGLPLFFLNITYQGVAFEKQYYFYFWTFLGIVSMIAQGMLGGKIEIRRTTLDIPLGIFWIVCVLASVFSVDKHHSVFGFFGNPVSGLVSITALILAYFLIVSYVNRKRSLLMWWAVVFSGSIVVLWSFLVTMRLVPVVLLKYITPSLMGSFTGLAIFLGMMLPIFIISFTLLEQSERNLRKRLLTAFLFVITLLTTFTMSVLFDYVQWLFVLAAIGLLLVFTMSRLVKVSQKTTAMTIVVFLIMFFFWMWGQPIAKRTLVQPEVFMNHSLSFDIAKEAIKNKPLLGSGLGTYGYDFSLYRPADLNQTGRYDIRFYSDRGAFFESFSTIGLAGVIALTIVVLTYVSTTIHAFIRSEDDDIKTISLGLFTASFIALIFGLLVSVDGVIILYGVLIAALTTGLLRSSLQDDNKLSLSMTASPQYALSFAFLSILVAVGVIFGFVTLGKMFVADVHAGNALRARVTGDFMKSTNLFDKATMLNGQEGRYYTVISQYALDLANIELAKQEGERNDDMVKTYVDIANGTAAAGKELMPNDVLANEIKGFVHENSGAFGVALDAYERASDLEPQNPYFDIAIGKLKLVEVQSKGEDAVEEKTALINEAKTYFEAAKEKTTFKYNGVDASLFAPAHYYISVVEEALGNVDESINAMATALQVTQIAGSNSQQSLSRQINYGFNLARLLQVRGTEADMANAERLLLEIIGVNDQEVNSHLSLGLLYERQGKRDEAVSEYKKIIAILPEEDEKARENIQNLVDTVEQGGSNIDVKEQGESSESPAPVESVESNTEEAPLSMLIVKGENSEDRAERGRDILAGQGYDNIEIREEGAEHEGVVIMYNKDADREKIQSIEAVLRGQFESVESERNDEEVSKYNHDVVVVIGKSADSGEGESEE